MRSAALIIFISSFMGGWPSWCQNVLQVPDDYATIQGAIDAAVDGDSVQVFPGYYEENIDFSGKAIDLIGVGGARRTTIDGFLGSDFDLPVVKFWSGEGPDSVLRGFTLRGSVIADTDIRGAAICAIEPNTFLRASPTIQDCILRDNFGGQSGGIAGNAQVERCIFFCNSTSGDGGAAGRGSLSFFDCSFIRNSGLTGGAIFVDSVFFGGSESATVSGCLFLENVAFDSARGGGILVESGSHSLTVDRSVFFHNSTRLCPPQGEQHGGAISNFSSESVLLDRSTIVGNWEFPGSFSGNYFGGVIGDVTATNTILWLNRGTQFAGTQADWCDIQDGYSGKGNIDSDPMFRDMAHLDFSLLPESPCIDMGDPAGSLDPDGTRADMGAVPFDHGQAVRQAGSSSQDPTSIEAGLSSSIRLPGPFEDGMASLVEDLFREDARDGGGFLGGPRLIIQPQAGSLSIELQGIPGAIAVLTLSDTPLAFELTRRELLRKRTRAKRSAVIVDSPVQALLARAEVKIVATTVLNAKGKALVRAPMPRAFSITDGAVLEAWSLSPRYGIWGSSNTVSLSTR